MNRRTFVLALGLATVTAGRGSMAQQPGKFWRIGILSLPGRQGAWTEARFGAFLRGMRELGYVEGKNIALEWRFADGKVERLPALAAELVQLKVDVIVTFGTQAVSAARKATATIPIVAAAFGDPVANGFAASLSRPGGNITGVTTLGEVLYVKRLELLATVAPGSVSVAFLINPDNASLTKGVPVYRAAAQKHGKELIVVNARHVGDFDAAFSAMARERVAALMVADDAYFVAQGSRIAELALRHKLPTVFGIAGLEAGSLISYGPPAAARFRRAATFVDRIFRGAKPGELPIEEPTEFELVVNLKTARALGITIPETLLLRADRVIE
ncbi:MAG: ABC transporter substrate-binding protein [Betaproteobacteria bacterium]